MSRDIDSDNPMETTTGKRSGWSAYKDRFKEVTKRVIEQNKIHRQNIEGFAGARGSWAVVNFAPTLRIVELESLKEEVPLPPGIRCRVVSFSRSCIRLRNREIIVGIRRTRYRSS